MTIYIAGERPGEVTLQPRFEPGWFDEAGRMTKPRRFEPLTPATFVRSILPAPGKVRLRRGETLREFPDAQSLDQWDHPVRDGDVIELELR